MLQRFQDCRERALKALTFLPLFSPVLQELMATLSGQTTSLNDVSDLIHADPVIAGKVLQIANSVLYCRSKQVASIRAAVALLGINKIRNIVFALSFNRTLGTMPEPPGWNRARFNLESLACGLICDSLAQRLPVASPQASFSAGLFHHLGHLLIAVTFPGEYRTIVNSSKPQGVSALDCEREVLGITHAELAAEALAEWNLPDVIQSAARFHHDPAIEAARLKPDEIGLALAVACADDYIRLTSLTLSGETPSDVDTPVEPFAPLGIKLESARFLEGVRAELEILGGVLHNGSNGVPEAPRSCSPAA